MIDTGIKMFLLIACTIPLLILVLIFFNLYSWPSLRTRRILSLIPGYSEIESWNVMFKAAALPVEGKSDILPIFGTVHLISVMKKI